MSRSYVCPNCSRSFTLADTVDGRAAACPWCNSTLTDAPPKRESSVGCGLWIAIGFVLLVGLLLAPFFLATNLDENQIEDEALLKAQSIAKAVSYYHLKSGKYPQSLDELVTETNGQQPLLEGGPAAITDPWGNPYQFEIGPAPDGSERAIVWTITPEGKRLQWPR